MGELLRPGSTCRTLGGIAHRRVRSSCAAFAALRLPARKVGGDDQAGGIVAGFCLDVGRRDADASRRRRAEVIDKVAAAIILQGALDRMRGLLQD